MVGHDIDHCSWNKEKTGPNLVPGSESSAKKEEKQAPAVPGCPKQAAGGELEITGTGNGVAGGPGPWEVVRRKKTPVAARGGAGKEVAGESGQHSQSIDLLVGENLSIQGKDDGDVHRLDSQGTPFVCKVAGEEQTLQAIAINGAANSNVSAGADGQAPLVATAPDARAERSSHQVTTGGKPLQTKSSIFQKDGGGPTIGINEMGLETSKDLAQTSDGSSSFRPTRSPRPAAREHKEIARSPVRAHNL